MGRRQHPRLPRATEQSTAVDSGHRALARGDWDEAHASFLTALEHQESAEALAGLGKAAWWLNDEATAFAARERAYRLYRQAGDRLSAARMALHLGSDECSLHNAYPVGDGWLQRAGRLLEGLHPAPEHAWLALLEGQIAMMSGHDSASACHSAAAVNLARSLSLLSVEKLALAQRGLALMREGDAAPLVRLDHHVRSAVANDLDHLDLVVSSSSCEPGTSCAISRPSNSGGPCLRISPDLRRLHACSGFAGLSTRPPCCGGEHGTRPKRSSKPR